MNRREFFNKTALTTIGSLLVPNFLKAYESLGKSFDGNGNILVIIQLSGGNDGLNTVIPYQNDIYYKGRPTLSVERSKVLRITDEIGLNPAMETLRKLYDDGQMSILNNVGYPNPDRSHFRSMDIWQTASNSDEYLSTGWLGRYLDATCSGDDAGSRKLLEIDDMLSLALKGNKMNGMASENPGKLYREVNKIQAGQLVASSGNRDDHDAVSYLYKTLAETVSSASYLYEKGKMKKSQAVYPSSELGRGLRTISELINAGADTKVYYVSIAGFDTHTDQKGKQDRLLKDYSEAVSSFVLDLKSTGQLNRTQILTFSEFGRRVNQNASRGTDHGTANNVFLMGGPSRTSVVYNEAPNLTDLDGGDLRYSIDFRDIYASLLRNWLGADDRVILGRNFAGLKNLV